MRKTPHNFGFTIVEVLISIAIALLLILGVNQVFSIAQQTSGAGTTALAQTEASRGAAAIMRTDFNAMVDGPDTPGIVIVSEAEYAYRNKQDLLANRNTAANAVQFVNDPSNPNNTTGIRQALSATSTRVHRIDRIMFFTRGVAPRQTAGSATPGVANDFSSRTAWLESYVWYGHLALPRNYTYNAQYSGPQPNYPNPFTGGDFRNPGDPGGNPSTATTWNPNNYFASDWILGRVPIVLVPFATPDSSGNPEITMAAGNATCTPLTILAVKNGVPARAFRQNAVGPQAQSSPIWPLYSSRYDMASTSIDRLRQFFASLPANSIAVPPWWEQLSAAFPSAPGGNLFDTRFEADPFPQRPQGLTAGQLAAWASAAMARQAPIFLRGCSQFIVEYAGDFLTQDNNPFSANFGNPTALQPDGDIDFAVTTLPSGEKVKRVRWYGFPRDVGGPIAANRPPGTPDGHIFWRDDVVPLRDVASFLTAGSSYAFERSVNGPPTGQVSTLPQRSDYAVPGAVQSGSQYICAWGPDLQPAMPRPKMIRITIALDDPTGRLNDEQYFEYVFNLP